MEKSKINFVIDALMFLCMAAIIGIGFLMKFSLIPGKERYLKYGKNVELFLSGMDRHEWGTIHLVIGFVLIGLLAIHIILHWKMILAMYRQLIGSQIARRITASAFIIVSAMFITFSFFVQIEVQEIKRGNEHYGARPGVEQIERPTAHPESSIGIRGFMTLSEVAETYNIPIDYLKMRIGLPQETPGGERLGSLRKRFDFKMSDVEKIIEEYHKSN